VQFYHMKKKAKVEVPDNQVRKQKMANGRYAVTATVDGTKVFKFLSEKDYRALNAPEAT
jgi:hypothetical protein